jgi:hypothetical protein
MPLSAGGSSERVVIDRLVITGVDYTLVVTPSDSVIRDPHFGHTANDLRYTAPIDGCEVRYSARRPDSAALVIW